MAANKDSSGAVVSELSWVSHAMLFRWGKRHPEYDIFSHVTSVCLEELNPIPTQLQSAVQSRHDDEATQSRHAVVAFQLLCPPQTPPPPQ